MSKHSSDAISTVDLSDYTSCDTSMRSRVIGRLGSALADHGFVIVAGHGVDGRLIADAYAGWRRFFALDEAVKRRYAGIDGGARGFTPFGVEHARDNPTPDLKEFWHVAQEPREGDAASPHSGNVWPQEVPDLRGPTLQLYRELERVAQLVLMALAEHFELPEETFSGLLRGGASVLRILHYPPIPPTPHPQATAGAGGAAGALRAAAHQDINLITLLCEATGAGLEVQRRDGVWLPIEPLPGQIVVDAGEMLARVTNDVVPAAVHRVVNPPVQSAPAGAAGGGERFSMPFFAHPRPDCELAVLERFTSHDRPGRFPPTTAGRLLAERLHEIGMQG